MKRFVALSAALASLAVPTTAIADIGASGSGADEPLGEKVKLKKSRFGKVLMDDRGMVLYLFTKEKAKGKSRCYDDCAEAWPPYLTKGKPRAGNGVKAKYLGTTKRRDGKTQVTYRGNPLYFYEHDRPGVILCHDVFEFGGTWLVLGADGRAKD